MNFLICYKIDINISCNIANGSNHNIVYIMDQSVGTIA